MREDNYAARIVKSYPPYTFTCDCPCGCKKTRNASGPIPRGWEPAGRDSFDNPEGKHICTACVREREKTAQS